jgi:hypothetical protein
VAKKTSKKIELGNATVLVKIAGPKIVVGINDAGIAIQRRGKWVDMSWDDLLKKVSEP